MNQYHLVSYHGPSNISQQALYAFESHIKHLPGVDERGNLDVVAKDGPIIFAPGESKSGIDLTSLDTRFTGKTNTAAAGGPLDEWTKVKRFPEYLMLIATKKSSSTNSELVEYAEEYHMRLKKSFRTVGLTGKVKDLVAEILDGKNTPAGMIYQDSKGNTKVERLNITTLHNIINNPGSMRLPDEIINLNIPNSKNTIPIQTNDEFLKVFNPANNKFAIYPQELYEVKNHAWISKFDKYKKQFPISTENKIIVKTAISGLSSALSLNENIEIGDIQSYPVRIIGENKNITKNLNIRVLRVNIKSNDIVIQEDGTIQSSDALEFIKRYERYANLIEEHLRENGEDIIVVLHIGKVNNNIYHDAIASLSRKLKPIESDKFQVNHWILDFPDNAQIYRLSIMFPLTSQDTFGSFIPNNVRRDVAGQKLMMMLLGDKNNDYYFYGAYRYGDELTSNSILNRLAMGYSNIQPKRTINTFWSARGKDQLNVTKWFNSYENLAGFKHKFFIQTKKGVKFDLDALRVYLEGLKAYFDFLNEDLIKYFIGAFDLSAKRNPIGSWNRSADQIQWFKKFVKSEGRDYALPAKYATKDHSKVIRSKDFLEMDLMNRDIDKVLSNTEIWFKYNPNNPDVRRRLFPPASNSKKGWKKGKIYTHAEPFLKLINPKLMKEIKEMKSISGETLERFTKKNHDIVDELWEKLLPIFRLILTEIIGDKNKGEINDEN